MSKTNVVTRDAGFDEADLDEQRTFSRNLALVIGINDYQHGYPSLETAVNDATVLAGILKEQHGYEVTSLLDDKATVPTLKREFNQKRKDSWAGQIGPDDRVIFYFAGHGIATDSDKGPTGYLLLQDANRTADSKGKLEMLTLHRWLEALPCRHLLVILDCCFAGAMRWSSPGTRDLPPDVIHQERYEHYIKSPAWQLITSAGYDERALDNTSDQDESLLGQIREKTDGGHSPFAQALIEGLRDGTGDIFPPSPQMGQPPGDGLITVTELILHLERAVGDAAAQVQHQQVPKLWPMTRHGSGEFVFLNPKRPLQLKPAPKLDESNNPYRIKALTEADYELFYGRENELNELVGLVQEQPVTLVVGASGVGKSSLVRAGLEPRLRGKTGPQSNTPANISGYDGNGAESNAANAPITINPGAWQVLPVLDLQESTDLKKLVGKIEPNQKTLLIIDHLDAVIDPDVGIQSPFLKDLQSLLKNGQNDLRVVLTIRADFVPHLKEFDLFPAEAHFKLGPLSSESNLRLALERPAWAKVLYFDPPQVVNTIVEEINQGPGALALLAEFGSQMYLNFIGRSSKDRAMTYTDCGTLGGVTKFIVKRAEEIYNQLDEAGQATMRRVMLRLLDVRGGVERRQAPRAEFVDGDQAEDERVEKILADLTAARLLVWDDFKDEPVIELAHNALVHDWDRLLIWSREAEEILPLQRRLTQAANEWAAAEEKKRGFAYLFEKLAKLFRSGGKNVADISDLGRKIMRLRRSKKKDLLWHNDAHLLQVEQILEQSQTSNKRVGFLRRGWRVIFPPTGIFEGISWLNRQESEFALQSVKERTNNIRRLLGTVAAVMIALIVLALFALVQWDEADTRARIARAGQLAAQSQAVLDQQTTESLLLALESLAMVDEDTAHQTASIQALRQALQRSAGFPLLNSDTGVVSSAVSPDLAWLALGSSDGRVQLWSTENHEAPLRNLPGHTEWVNIVAFSPDSAQLATGSDDGTVLIWSLNDLDKAPLKLIQDDWVWDVHFSPDGTWLLTGSDDGKLMRWSLETPEAAPELLADFDIPIRKVGLQADGTVLAAGFEEEATEAMLWIVADETHAIPLAYNELVQGLDISPDGQWLAVGYEDGAGLIWAVNDLEREPTFLDLPSGVSTPKFSPGGTRLAVGSVDGTICVWQMDNLQAAPMLLGHGAAISTISFVDEIALITASQNDETVRLWQTANPAADPVAIFGHTDEIWEVAFSPDGQWLATASEDTTVRLWPTDTLEDPFRDEPQILDGHTNWVLALAFSPDGQWLVTGDRDGNLYLRATADPQVIAHTFQTSGDPGVSTAAISPDSRWLATGHIGAVRLWSLEDPQTTPEKELNDQEDRIWDLSFSPDGAWLASAGGDGSLLLYSMIDPAANFLPLAIDEGWISAVEFSRDGRYLATGEGNGDIFLWEMTGSIEAPISDRVIWSGHEGAVRSIDFSPDGQWLATGSDDNTVRLWAMDHFKEDNTSPPEPLLLKHNKVAMSVAFSPNGSELATGGGENLVRLWLTDVTAMKETACLYANRNFTEFEWEKYFPEEDYRRTCLEFPGAVEETE